MKENFHPNSLVAKLIAEREARDVAWRAQIQESLRASIARYEAKPFKTLSTLYFWIVACSGILSYCLFVASALLVSADYAALFFLATLLIFSGLLVETYTPKTNSK